LVSSSVPPAAPPSAVASVATLEFAGVAEIGLWTAVCRTCVPNQELGRRELRPEIDARTDAHRAEAGNSQHDVDVFPES
jgi:hypothetical protein